MPDTSPICGFTPPGLHPGDPPATPWLCLGLRLTFDQPVQLAPAAAAGGRFGMRSGFELANDVPPPPPSPPRTAAAAVTATAAAAPAAAAAARGEAEDEAEDKGGGGGGGGGGGRVEVCA